MNLSDIFIVYLTLGAPLAVYKYLQMSGTSRPHRIWAALLTFTFWLPEAFRLGRRYFSNAYTASGFVSASELDSMRSGLAEIAAKSAAVPNERRHIARRNAESTLESYVALSVLAGRSFSRFAGSDLLKAAGRTETQLGAVCLERRNRRKVLEHREQARRHFLDLVDELSETLRAVGIAREIAIAVRDDAATESLTRLMATFEESHQIPTSIRGQVSGEAAGS